MFKLISTTCFVVLMHSLWAQNNLHIDSNAKLSNFGEIAVFGDLTNHGEYYAANNNAMLYFLGSYWQNDPNAQNSGQGGVHFIQPNTLYGTNVLQNLDGGGYDAGFAQLILENDNGLLLLGDLGVRNRLDFIAGKITLDGNNLKIDNGGSITGYDEEHFIITNGLPSDQSGYLIREGTNIVLDYPIGFSADDYSPARIENLGENDQYKVRAFPNVYESGNSGAILNDSSVGLSWEILEAIEGGSEVNLRLQHHKSLEGNRFSTERNYIARYVGPASSRPTGIMSLPNLAEWDFVGGENCGGNQDEDISTGTDNPLMFSNTRTNLDNFTDYTYYTVYNCEFDVPESYNFPNAFSPNGDGVNDTWVISELALFERRKLTIVNRWGDVVYHTESYQNDWDGTLRGSKLPAGTYYYIFDLGGNTGIRKGPVTIVRN